MFKQSLATLCSLLSCAAMASPTQMQHIIVAPNCLATKVTSGSTALASNKHFTLMQINNQALDQFILAKSQRGANCGSFMDVTQAYADYRNQFTHQVNHAKQFLRQYTASPQPASLTQNHAYAIQYEKQVNQLLGQINPQIMWSTLSSLSSYRDRYANSDDGVNAANWIKSYVETIATEAHRDDIQVRLIKTGSRYRQPSVVVKIGNSNEAGIVIGAHLDTLSGKMSRKPGADDDGSGSVTVLELARTLVSSDMRFHKPIYLMWYAAEEEGLVGSGYVVNEFKQSMLPVDAVLHFDMTGYAHQNDPTLWLMDDYVNPALTTFLHNLIKTYVKQPVKYTSCGYACSDHASWTQAGYPAAIAAEAAFENTNPNMHSASDTMDKLSLSHMTDYLKLAVAYTVELAQPIA